MAPKGSVSKRKGAAVPSAPSPLSLYKRGLTAVRNWTPPTSTRADAEALTGLAACCRLLQARMGLMEPPPAAVGTPQLLTATITPITMMTSAGANTGNGCSDTGKGHAGGSGGVGELLASVTGVIDPLAESWAALVALEPGMASYCAIVRHSLDLDIEDWQDEPGFLLASAHLEIGKVLGRMFPRRELLEQLHLEAALKLFPDFVAAGVTLGQALLARADHPDHLTGAEKRLKTAITVTERLQAGGGGDGEGGGGEGRGGTAEDGLLPSASSSLLLEANTACRREWEAGQGAVRSLAMLLCQAGRDEEAVPYLEAMEFTHRLARQVLHYPADPLLSSTSETAPTSEITGASTAAENGAAVAPLPPSPSPSPSPLVGYSRYVRAVDGALPPALLRVLRFALSPNSRFWSEHGYGRVGYFSYMHELGSPCLSAIHQAAVLLHRLAVQRFPAAAEARYAEWWAHCRRHPSGHQLHFDSDDEGVGGVRNPIVSGVIYLTGGVGGPTLVTPQLLGGPLAPHGWLVYPRENRLGMFDSTLLHGVIPGRGPSPRPGEYRITLMIAFWKNIQCRPRDDGLPGPSQPFPITHGSPATATATATTTSRYTWMADLVSHPDGPDGWGMTDPRDVVPTAIERVWERLDGSAALPGAVQYDACFQGF